MKYVIVHNQPGCLPEEVSYQKDLPAAKSVAAAWAEHFHHHEVAVYIRIGRMERRPAMYIDEPTPTDYCHIDVSTGATGDPPP